MTAGTTNFSASVAARLLQRAKQTGDVYQTVLTSFCAYVEQEPAGFELLGARVREAIDLLEELRTTLISAAVTGKIDGRGEVA